MNKKLDLGEKLETASRPPAPVRLLCSDAKGRKPIIVLIEREDCDVMRRVSLSGRYFLDRESSYDIVNKILSKTIYINLYKSGHHSSYSSRIDADVVCNTNRIACKEVVITEGEGLDE